MNPPASAFSAHSDDSRKDVKKLPILISLLIGSFFSMLACMFTDLL
ncbi:hypothetical protein ACUXCC_003930 [Cytobacillus horneckiae]|nr:hypothetical protein [Cytobacillus horneckiae]MBN6888779.1 hypothetical protein [Cytobacillus horneckiae]